MATKKGKEKKPEKRKLNLSPEERKRRSERMQKLREQGKVGPEFGKLGGRPRKRAGEEVAEGASNKRKAIMKVFEDAIAEDQPITIRMKGAEALLKAEEREGRLQLDEEERIQRMKGDELAKWLASRINANPVLRDRLLAQMRAEADEGEEFIEGEVTGEEDVEPKQIEAPDGEGD